MRFRKKPVVIDAVPVAQVLEDAKGNWPALPDWVRDAYEQHQLVFTNREVFILTLEGELRADHGDWLLRGVAGELYPCKPLIFEQTYEPAD